MKIGDSVEITGKALSYRGMIGKIVLIYANDQIEVEFEDESRFRYWPLDVTSVTDEPVKITDRKYAIANQDRTKFLDIDPISGGCPYWTEYFWECKRFTTLEEASKYLTGANRLDYIKEQMPQIVIFNLEIIS